ncbi:MAG: hypothetical protein KDD25_04125, partial [Bdellovibrionales bacterium]|nr:hypothetical protein [Bdellovibrionales bacterium]
MALLDRKYWMGLLTASLALSLVAACAPRKKDWKTRVNVDPRKVGGAGEKGNGEKTGPGGTPTLPGVTGSGGLSEVAGSNGKCISLTANRSEPLFVDQAIGQYFSQQGPSIKLVSNEEADKSDLKKFRVISTGKDIVVGTDELVYDFSKAVLDPSGCFKVVVDQKTLEDSKSIGNSPVALLFLDNSGLTVQIRDYSDE